MRALIYVSAVLLFAVVYSSTSKTEGMATKEVPSLPRTIDSDITGSWEIITETPRGTRKGVVQIV